MAACNYFTSQLSMLKTEVPACWHNIFFCEFDGPRETRRVLCTVIQDRP
jgi:hypothetical protein